MTDISELWTCPDCGRQFANRNQAHSCVTITLDEHLADASSLAVELYEAVEAALRACGDFRIHAQQTRIAFITTMTFAGVRLARGWADLSLITPTPIEGPRIRRVELYGPTSFASEVRLHATEDIDAEVHEWLCLAYERGLQETLDPKASVEPVSGPTLERLRVPLVSHVVAYGEALGLSVPRYAVEAFAAHPLVVARLAGTTVTGELDDAGVLVADLSSLGLGEGDPADVTLTADL